MRTLSKISPPKFSLAMLLALSVLGAEARADVSASGDFSPSPLGDEGGPISSDLIIGDTGIAGFFMDAAPPLFNPLAPLEAPNVIIGNQANSIGAMTLEDFMGGDIVATGDFTLGNEGQGFLDLFDSGSVTVGSRFTIGEGVEGSGLATINGQGSRIITNEFVAGDAGYGELNITNRGILISSGNSTLGNGIGGVGIVTVTDQGSRWSAGSQLTVGGLGSGALNIEAQALVQISDSAVIGPSGIVNLKSGGRLRALSTSSAAVAITNDGNLRGGGFVDFTGKELINQGFGLIRNKALNSGTMTELPDPQTLIFTGALLTNNSTIFAQDGEMIFNVPVVNNSEFIVKDSFVQFTQGLDNTGGGTVIVGGDSTLHGTITPAPLSNFVILNDSIVTITGDLIFTEPFLLTAGEEDSVAASGSNAATLSIGIGNNPGYLTVVGNLDLTNAVLDLDFAGTAAPVVGDIVNLIQVNGDVTGTFENSTVNVGGQVWQIDYSGGDIFATFTGIDSLPGDFNADGRVDGRDFLAWQRNPSVGSLSDWQSSYGQGGSLTAAATAVPEPGTIVLLLAAALGMVARKR